MHFQATQTVALKLTTRQNVKLPADIMSKPAQFGIKTIQLATQRNSKDESDETSNLKQCSRDARKPIAVPVRKLSDRGILSVEQWRQMPPGKR